WTRRTRAGRSAHRSRSVWRADESTRFAERAAAHRARAALRPRLRRAGDRPAARRRARHCQDASRARPRQAARSDGGAPMTTCDVVAERVALGEPLGDAAEHAERCPKCRRLVALPAELGATHRELDPGLGFSARMT